MLEDSVIYYCAFTVDHLLNSIYYATKIESNNKKILIWQHFLSKDIDLKLINTYFDEIIEVPRIPYNFFYRKLHKLIYHGYFFKLSDVYKKLLSDKPIALFVFSDQDALTQNIFRHIKRNTCITFLVDEGLGTYYIPPKGNEYKVKLLDKLLGIKTCDYIGDSNYIDCLLVKRPSELPVEKIRERKIILKNDIYLDQEWISQLAFLKRVNFPPKYKDTILWLSGPLCELGISEQEEISILQQLVSLSSDYLFLIKRHPAENEHKYDSLLSNKNVLILELDELFWLPIELLVDVIKPSAIFTVVSSAVGNIINIGVKCKYLYLYNLFNDFEFDFSLFDPFKKIRNVYFPQNESEVIEILLFDYEETNNMFINQNQDIRYIDGVIKQRLFIEAISYEQ